MPDNDIPRQLPAAAGLAWLKTGFALYRKNPLLLTAGTTIFFMAMLLLGIIPYVGQVLSELATPIFVAGFMAAFRALDEGEELELPHFFAGFTNKPQQLAVVGAVYLLLSILIAWVALRLGFNPKALMEAASAGDKINPQDAQHLLQTTLPILLLTLVLLIPIGMATWFAVPLIFFGGAGPFQALAISFKASWKNWLAFTVFGLLGFLIWIVAVILLGILAYVLGPLTGVLFLLLLLMSWSLLFATIYASYQAVFAIWRGEDQASSAPESSL